MKLIKLEQPSCHPCQLVSNYLKEKEIEFEAIDVNQRPEIAAEYGVMGCPSLFCLMKGETKQNVASVLSQMN